ncbi:CGNR zinc finger domain-containing protein [Pseudomonas sp. HR96]|uniref:CGNR zinc finger domain-containing protein n=1 Tax=Pseudomonas sp. HR96 TaxID=1027966 RepID=UPI002A7613C5|nr:CGNR zinc finger domain-containing protein [Pseudomonas sp. HR96]WPP01265.1 CGNR zinc finger domain-containing protein [Pseudomonas sp. HR96]
MPTPHSAQVLPAPLLLADHPVLDLLNTRMMVEGQRRDLLTDVHAATAWFEQAGLADGALLQQGVDGDWLSELHLLRDCLETLVQARLDGNSADTRGLDHFLARAVPRLVWEQGAAPQLDRFGALDPASRALVQLAYHGAELLAEGDFSLVRHCESADCSLMFYDRTKSHKRRWCSMGLCGNRHKVAQYRKRQLSG